MEKLKKFTTEQPIVLIILVLACISCFAIWNAAPLISSKVTSSPDTLWIKQATFYILSAIVVYIVYRIGNEAIYDNIWIIYGILIALLVILALDHLLYNYVFGKDIIPLAHTSNGATSWINLPGFSLQPSEFMKIAMIIALARVTKEHNDYYLIKSLETELRYIVKCLTVVLPPAILVYLQNDSGVAMILLVGFVFVMFASGLRSQWFAFGITALVLIIGTGAYLYVYQPDAFSSLMSAHQVKRFAGWLDPEGTIADEGYQLFYSLLSYGTAGWFGHGFQSVIKSFPEAQTDFIFAVILTDFGYIGGIVTVLAIVALDIVILKIGFESTNDRDKYMTMGIIGMMIFQQIWNMGMILGLLPITGITLPFISYGGSSLLSYMISIGMFMDINSQNNIVKNRNIVT
ncbi:MAG: FtsW/RodA/SpoVE family cell cycle protein [Erysipelotrichaceae bacterium]|nr:FtsW/RodA/SpoVE family cell cycle protein [Erysipelotrichaceae bacterium]